MRGLDRAGVTAGTRLLVIGGGQMGLLIIQAALARGAHAAVVEPRPERLALAKAFGAAEPEAPGDVVILATSHADAWELALTSVARGGVIQLFAPSRPGETRAFDAHDLFFREVDIQATYSAGPRDTRAALDLLASGAVTADGIITHRYALQDTAAALATARRREGVKVIVTS